MYKVRLQSGRVLGPLSIERIRKLILKKKIIGVEVAREYPLGEWKDINAIQEIAQMLLLQAEGELKPSSKKSKIDRSHDSGTPFLPGATKTGMRLSPLPVKSDQPTDVNKTVLIAEPTHRPDDKTKPAVSPPPPPKKKSDPFHDDEPTKVSGTPIVPIQNQDALPVEQTRAAMEELSDQPTQMVMNPQWGEAAAATSTPPTKRRFRIPTKKEAIRIVVIGALLGYFGYTTFWEGSRESVPTFHTIRVKAKLPNLTATRGDPVKSGELYLRGLKFYVLDTVPAYQTASEYFSAAAQVDPGNIKALAMLTSCYLNLIDSTDKGEDYFATLTKLLDLTRAKKIDLAEEVIADAEFSIASNRPETAQRRIVEYTKQNQNFGPEMFYYLALASFHRGEYSTAAQFINQISDSKTYSAKVPYLRGVINERLGDSADALLEYRRAIKFYDQHAKSHLRVAEYLKKTQGIQAAKEEIQFLNAHADLLPPQDQAQAYYLTALLLEDNKNNKQALQAVEKSVVLVPENPDYMLELYTLRHKLGEEASRFRAEARMYFCLSEGERRLKTGDTHGALTEFLKAREERPESPIPPIKIGDMFRRLGDLVNAKMNYKLAADRAPNDIRIWSKYIDTLIQCFEWEEAQSAMDRFRELLPESKQSTLDKAAGDLYAKQGRFQEAQNYYKRAMSREIIDSTVYLAAAKSLLATKNYKDAQLLFAIALRNDPGNTEAMIGTAKCVAETESIERAITLLQDEVQQGSRDSAANRADLLSAIAELQLQRGETNQAQNDVDQAMAASPLSARPWKVQAQIDLQKEGVDRKATEKAIDAWKSYTERNPSDVTAYFERFQLYAKKLRYREAIDELSKIYEMYPKYPSLHYYKAGLLVQMGNTKAAIDEYQAEIKNHPNSSGVFFAMGRLLNDLNRPEEALKALNQAMLLDPKSADAKQQAGYSNFLLKNYPAAIALYNAALVYDKANPALYKRLGVAYRESGDNVKAQQAFAKYREMEPDAPDRGQFQ